MKKSALFGFLLFATPALRAQTPAPQPTPFPQPTNTPAPAPTPGVTPTPGATPPVSPSATPVASASATPAASPAPTASPTPVPPKTVEELTRGFEKIDGILTLYRKVENNRQRLLAFVREDQIGPLWMLQSTFASGAASRVTTGRPARDLLFRWEKTPDDRLILSTPNLWYRAQDANLQKAVERDFPNSYLAVFPILARDKEKNGVLIDIAKIFDGSVTGLNTLLEPQGAARQFLDTYALDSELTFVDKLRNFPTNLVVESNFNFRRVGRAESETQTLADPRTLPVRVTFNIYRLPENNGYRPRLADPRVGYFVNGQLQAGRTGFESFDFTRKDPRVVYINRWNLQKSPTGAPVQPIVFYLDNSVPQRFRRAMREGILVWNRAFEKIGFSNAVEVRETLPADYDSSDMRFNSLRFVASPPTGGRAYAVALLRENPLSGEIINASITVDANFTRAVFREKEDVVNPLSSGKNSHRYLHQHADGSVCGFEPAPDPRFVETQEYIDDYLRALVAHEMGHILGLRHNFLASTFLTPKDLADKAKTRAEGTSASVMDYVGFNVFGLQTGAQLFSKEPGRYDTWAIEYGYTPFLPSLEAEGLRKIAARATQPGLAYYGDEVADDYDPTVVRYDLSSDPLAYAAKSLEVTQRLLRDLEKNEVKTGDSYARFTRRLRGLLRSRGRDGEIAARFIGGYRLRRVVKGDQTQNVPFSPIPASQQKRAMALLAREIFAPGAFAVPESYLRKTAADPFDFNDPAADSAFPIRDDITRTRAAILASLFENPRLKRMENGDWKFREGYAMPQLFSDASRAVWGELKPTVALDSIQRDLAKSHLEIMVDLSIDKRPGAPDDARLLATSELSALKTRLLPARKSSPDPLSRLFFADAIRRIDAALAKKPYSD